MPLAERIAVHDNDGTLWPENPMPFQAAFAIDELNRRILTEPELASDPMAQAALAGDFAKLLQGKHFDGLMQVLALTHAGMTTDEFRSAVESWLTWSKHPRFGRLYDELTYQPMQELLRLLRANGFKNFIVSAAGADFIRVWVERVYGIPPEQVGARRRHEADMMLHHRLLASWLLAHIKKPARPFFCLSESSAARSLRSAATGA